MSVDLKFKEGKWSTSIEVKDFVSKNISPYHGDHHFLCGPTEATKALWDICKSELKKERANNGLHSVDTKTISASNAFPAGYIDKEKETIVGLQTDALLKRAMKPFGGFKVVEKALSEHGLKPADDVSKVFKHAKTHNDGVFDAYTDEIRTFRSLGFLTGLPDNYARGRIIGDYRRMALYGIDRLIESKKEDLSNISGPMSDATIRLREEVSEQIKALYQMIEMGNVYGLNLKRPAENAQEAIQWTYMAYLAAVKEQDGAAMSLGSVSSFFDVYIEKDINEGLITEEWRGIFCWYALLVCL
jgi:formate C-acetyltransferase